MVHDVVCRGSSAWPCRGTVGLRASARARSSAARFGAVCHAVVLPADIFIGGRATCNRLRGIRTERCFAHLYPRFAGRPIQRQPSLLVLALSRRFPSTPRPLSFLHRIRSPFILCSPQLVSFLSLSLISSSCSFRPPARYHCPWHLKRPRIVPFRRRPAGAKPRDDILAAGY